ncbi:hypothetical protein SKAU_G00407480 [Synaphobranchus kaupii]|uniref:Uncharacterized protein n=1 Tax=Synaphobranchus kaupii TaxID=118154 RepID=A0A9Q1EA88_SYNKA|nr:hypothetical protein SKAU_G00407480 [Synaphobranchus kaupii]
MSNVRFENKLPLFKAGKLNKVVWMMKASKLPASTRERCGVWLDTADLRRDKKVVGPRLPISKLLNPLAPFRGYRVPVAMSFTQTKLHFPATTQSSITAFLCPRHHGKEEAEPAAVMATPLSTLDATTLGKKRKRLGGPVGPAYQRVGGLGPPQASPGGGSRGGVQEGGPGGGSRGGCLRLPVSWKTEEEVEEPAKKRLCVPDSRETLLCHFTQGSHALSHQGAGKENSQRPLLPPSSPPSPKTTSWRRESSCLSPRKRPLHNLPETQVESRSQLFTQDSEGRQVIAHRGALDRTPLQDCGNFTPPWTVPSLPLLQGEPDSELGPEMLFTQDSQGNRVIKH